MQTFTYLRASSVTEAELLLRTHPEARALAGGQSLLAAMKLGLNAPSHLVDLQDIPDLQELRLDGDTLHIGAMVSHARIAHSPEVHAFCPMLCGLARGIADEQVRAVGTIGGSLANNDPAACWPAGVLALGATLVTSRRNIAADDFFSGLYGTALTPGEVVVAVRFGRPLAAHYLKHEQPASRFAMLGVAVARFEGAGSATVRVAITGLGQGVVRWPAAEQALAGRWQLAALDGLTLDPGEALGDIHASAAYRAHLAAVLCRRGLAALTGEAIPRVRHQVPPPSPATATGMPLAGVHQLALPLEQVWAGMLDPDVLQRCIPGCESMQAIGKDRYLATVRLGIGPVSARFQTQIVLSDQRPPGASHEAGCSLRIEGQAGGLGHGQAFVQVQLVQHDANTSLTWQARTQVGGRIAQFGDRLIAATAHKLSHEFFQRFAATLQAERAGSPPPATLSRFQAFCARLEHFLHAIFRR